MGSCVSSETGDNDSVDKPENNSSSSNFVVANNPASISKGIPINNKEYTDQRKISFNASICSRRNRRRDSDIRDMSLENGCNEEEAEPVQFYENLYLADEEPVRVLEACQNILLRRMSAPVISCSSNYHTESSPVRMEKLPMHMEYHCFQDVVGVMVDNSNIDLLYEAPNNARLSKGSMDRVEDCITDSKCRKKQNMDFVYNDVMHKCQTQKLQQDVFVQTILSKNDEHFPAIVRQPGKDRYQMKNVFQKEGEKQSYLPTKQSRKLVYDNFIQPKSRFSFPKNDKRDKEQNTALPALPALSALPALPALSALPARLALPALPDLPVLSALPALQFLSALPDLPVLSALPALPDLPALSALPALPFLPALSALPALLSFPYS